MQKSVLTLCWGPLCLLFSSWMITSICNDILELRKVFRSYNFCWVKKEANGMVHSLAIAAALCFLSFNYNFSAIPPPVWEALYRDSLVSFG